MKSKKLLQYAFIQDFLHFFIFPFILENIEQNMTYIYIYFKYQTYLVYILNTKHLHSIDNTKTLELVKTTSLTKNILYS